MLALRFFSLVNKGDGLGGWEDTQQLFASRRHLCVTESSGRRKATTPVISQCRMGSKNDRRQAWHAWAVRYLVGGILVVCGSRFLHLAYVVESMWRSRPRRGSQCTSHAMHTTDIWQSRRRMGAKDREGPRVWVAHSPRIPYIADRRSKKPPRPGRFGAGTISSRRSCRPRNGDAAYRVYSVSIYLRRWSVPAGATMGWQSAALAN